MSEREAFLHAICENPDDDTPRLVFADWLDEHGEADRAEFIRLQIEIAGLPEGVKKKKKQTREKQLLNMHKEKWTEHLKEFQASRTLHPTLDGTFCKFRRGFVDGIHSDAPALLEQGERLFTLAPIRELRLWDAEWDECQELAKCKWLLRVYALDLSAKALFNGSGVDYLLRSRYLANLKSLDMRATCEIIMDAPTLRAVAGAKHLFNLTRLDLRGQYMFGPADSEDDPDPRACKKILPRLGEKMPALRELNLHGTGLHDDDIDGLVGQAWVKQLRIIDLSTNQITDEGCRVLCESKSFAKLERLNLTDSHFYDATANARRRFSDATQQMLKKRFGKGLVL
jgi:uncharacterized protein (TIGR02996 family)